MTLREAFEQAINTPIDWQRLGTVVITSAVVAIVITLFPLALALWRSWRRP
jgi:hypothetical protein